MKKVKHISLGDKVFAKVKGYPAWPARVDEDLGTGKRFKVYFYGTGETGLVKAEDLFSYLEHKEQFVKSLKRKDYNDAIEEIEAAIAQDQDGIVLDDTEEVKPTSDIEKEEEIKRGLKRKLSVDSSTAESRKKSAKNSAGPKSSKNAEERLKPTDSGTAHSRKSPESFLSDEENELEYHEKSNNNREHKANDESSSEEDYDEVNKKDTTPTKFKVVTPQSLREIIEEFEKFIKDAEKGNEKPEDDSSEAQNEVLLARLTPDQYVGIKLNQNRPDKIETELERLRWKEAEARNALELKEKVEDGTVRPEDKPELFEFDLELTEDQLSEAIKNRIMERKRTKLKFLKIEASLVELDAAIKTNLALDKADPKEALKDLDVMLKLNIEPLMLKKHSHVMEMVKRLRRYIGNVKEWKLQGKELDEFKKDAEQIRAKADIVYSKFKALFTIPEDKTFWEVFNEECEKFKNLTKDMNENQMFILCAEPGTKQARWDALDDQEENKLISERNEKKTHDKENSSQVINSEENFADLSAENSNLTHTSTDSHG